MDEADHPKAIGFVAIGSRWVAMTDGFVRAATPAES